MVLSGLRCSNDRSNSPGGAAAGLLCARATAAQVARMKQQTARGIARHDTEARSRADSPPTGSIALDKMHAPGAGSRACDQDGRDVLRFPEMSEKVRKGPIAP